MKIQDILVNMGEEKTQKTFFGSSCIRTLKILDSNIVKPENLHRLILEKFSKSEMLRDKKIRSALINSLRSESIQKLAQTWGLNPEHDKMYSTLANFSVSKNSKKEKILFEFFETDWHEYKNPKKLHSIINAEPDRPLFDHQINAIEKIKIHLNSSDPRVLLHMPTGSGKTRTAMRIISDFFLEDKSTLIIWLAHSEELTEQAIEEFQAAWKSAGNRTIPIYRFFKKNSPDLLNPDHKTGFIVAGLKKMNNEATKNKLFLTTLSDRVTLIVMDEAHQAIADTNKFILKYLVEKHNAKLLGLSATPGRTWNDKTKDAELASFFHRKKITLDVGKNPIDFLIENQFIAKPNIKKLDYDAKLTKEIDQISLAIDIPESILNRLAKDEQRNIKIIQSVEKLIKEDHKRIIIFAINLSHARDIALILYARGHMAYYVDGTTFHDIRRKIIEEYKSDSSEPRVICNFGVLTTGFDAP